MYRSTNHTPTYLLLAYCLILQTMRRLAVTGIFYQLELITSKKVRSEVIWISQYCFNNLQFRNGCKPVIMTSFTLLFLLSTHYFHGYRVGTLLLPHSLRCNYSGSVEQGNVSLDGSYQHGSAKRWVAWITKRFCKDIWSWHEPTGIWCNRNVSIYFW